MAEDPATRTLFDAQAASFQSRAGLPQDVRERVAAALIDLGGLREGRLVVDIGAGTGDIGLELLARGIGYVGIDVSDGMLQVFRGAAAAAGLHPSLVVADAAAPWPVPAGAAGLVFGSRSLHWLDPRHVAAQAFRAASPRGSRLLIGRVVRDPTSPKQRARRAMRQLLSRDGIEGRSGKRSAAAIVEECLLRGGVHVPSRVVATWTARGSIRDSIEAWRGKPGLAGTDVAETAKERILGELSRFTSEAFGNIDTLVESTEQYVLEGATLIADGT